MACAPYSGAFTRGFIELAVYIGGDAFGIFVKYPVPKIAINGPITTFSLNVTLKNSNIMYGIYSMTIS